MKIKSVTKKIILSNNKELEYKIEIEESNSSYITIVGELYIDNDILLDENNTLRPKLIPILLQHRGELHKKEKYSVLHYTYSDLNIFRKSLLSRVEQILNDIVEHIDFYIEK